MSDTHRFETPRWSLDLPAAIRGKTHAPPPELTSIAGFRGEITPETTAEIIVSTRNRGEDSLRKHAEPRSVRRPRSPSGAPAGN